MQSIPLICYEVIDYINGVGKYIIDILVTNYNNFVDYIKLLMDEKQRKRIKSLFDFNFCWCVTYKLST